MRTTININDELLAKAIEFTQIKERATLVNQALKILVEKYAAERLIKLGGKDKNAKAATRRK